jgi:hypothetical protein
MVTSVSDEGIVTVGRYHGKPWPLGREVEMGSVGAGQSGPGEPSAWSTLFGLCHIKVISSNNWKDGWSSWSLTSSLSSDIRKVALWHHHVALSVSLLARHQVALHASEQSPTLSSGVHSHIGAPPQPAPLVGMA